MKLTRYLDIEIDGRYERQCEGCEGSIPAGTPYLELSIEDMDISRFVALCARCVAAAAKELEPPIVSIEPVASLPGARGEAS